MKLETFFEKFDLFADAPDALTKVRELVLQLAVTGKLLTQDKRDEPASVLLESTKAERAKLVAAKKIKTRPTSPDELNEQSFDLPSSWVWARLSDVGYELGQKVPDKRFTYIDVGGIDSDKGRISDRVEKLEPGNAPSRARKLVARGTVIYSTVRPYLLNIAIVDQDFDPEPIASTAFGILHPFCGISNHYLFYWLRSGPFTAYVQAGMKGMAYPAINDEKFYRGPIALPPLAEQKRIVAKVDELMALCDRLEAQQQERETRHTKLARASLARFADAPTPANLDMLFYPTPCLRASVRKAKNGSHKGIEAQSPSTFLVSPADLRKSILTLAVQGKLVPQDPNDEPVPRLPLLVGLEQHLHKIPSEWSWTTWEGVLAPGKSAFKRGPFGSSLRKSDFVESGYKVFEQYCPINDDCSFARYYITPEKFETMKSFAVQAGDFLISCSGVTLGRITQVPPVFEAGVINQALLRVRINSAILDAPYFKMLFRSPFFQERILANSTGSAIPNVKGVKDLKAMPIPLPPLAEQRRIVAKVEQLMALVDELETQLAAARTTASALLDAVVHELTSGGRMGSGTSNFNFDRPLLNGERPLNKIEV